VHEDILREFLQAIAKLVQFIFAKRFLRTFCKNKKRRNPEVTPL